MALGQRLVLLAALVAPAWGTVWVKGSGGASCETVCAARSGCNEQAWPQTEEEFKEVAESAGQECETTQEGGAKYDPSTDGHHCGWKGPDEANSEDGGRCAGAGDAGTYRFCPCNSDKEL